MFVSVSLKIRQMLTYVRHIRLHDYACSLYVNAIFASRGFWMTFLRWPLTGIWAGLWVFIFNHPRLSSGVRNMHLDSHTASAVWYFGIKWHSTSIISTLLHWAKKIDHKPINLIRKAAGRKQKWVKIHSMEVLSLSAFLSLRRMTCWVQILKVQSLTLQISLYHHKVRRYLHRSTWLLR